MALQLQGTYMLEDVLISGEKFKEVVSALALDLPPSLSFTSQVTAYGGVISSWHQLVSNGDFIRITPDNSQVGVCLLVYIYTCTYIWVWVKFTNDPSTNTGVPVCPAFV